MRTIQHPGVEVNEIDISQYTPAAAGTTSLIIGFADKGEDYLPLEFTSIKSWLTYFGKPTNEAERYFYAGSVESIGQNGKTIVTKLPYENDNKDQYITSVYGVSNYSAFTAELSAPYNEYDVTSGSVNITAPTLSSIPLDTLDQYRTNTLNPNDGDIVIVDVTKSKLGVDVLGREILGTQVVINGAYNALPLQNMLSGYPTDWESVQSSSTSGGETATNSQLVTQYWDENNHSISKNTISNQTASLFPAIVLDEDGELDQEYLQQISVTVLQQYVDVDNNNRIGTAMLETFVGSLDVNYRDPATNESLFIDDIVNDNSNYINLFSNISGDKLVTTGGMYKMVTHETNTFGYTKSQVAKNIQLSTLLSGLTTIFGKLDNIDVTEIDIVTDAGITTIAQFIKQTYGEDAGEFNPIGDEASSFIFESKNDISIWKSVASKYIDFCANTRRDCMTILDGPRNLALEGNQKVVRPSAPTNSVDVDVLPLLKYMTGLNSSYASMYIDWYQKLDDFSGKQYWCPPSIIANGAYIYTDRVADYWSSPAGYNRGVIYTASDIAFNPNGRQQDAIYTKGFNYAINTPYNGIILTGDKTLQTKPSAFDRINVRRMFLRLERIVRKLSKYYLYEGNTSFTRNRFVDQITPIFTEVMIGGGIYDFKIICDTTNNTPEVIDRNEMICTIMLKPVKSINFITLNFVATSSGASFDEIVI